MQQLTLGDGCRIAYRFDGPSDAPILLLSNSLGTDMEMWAPQMAGLAAHVRVLRYDTRGHGRSDAPAGAYSLDRLGRDVIELLDGLGLDRVHFCGLSLGGMVGQWLGIRAPERLDRLILANTSGFMGPPANWDARIAAVASDGMSLLASSSVARWFTPAFASAAPEAIAPILTTLGANSPTGYAGCCAAIRDMDQRRLAHLIRTPTLVIAGTSDPATPLSHSEALVEAIPGARHMWLEAAHLSNVERPKAFTQAVLDFLSPAA